MNEAEMRSALKTLQDKAQITPQMGQMMSVLEKFNGVSFLDFPTTGDASLPNGQQFNPVNPGGRNTVSAYSNKQLVLLNQSYEALKQSPWDAGHALSVNIEGRSGPTYQAWQDKLTILEHFNGRTFNAVPSGSGAVTVNLRTTTQDLLQQSYDALKSSLYQSLPCKPGSRDTSIRSA